jgi:hypothetical protein
MTKHPTLIPKLELTLLTAILITSKEPTQTNMMIQSYFENDSRSLQRSLSPAYPKLYKWSLSMMTYLHAFAAAPIDGASATHERVLACMFLWECCQKQYHFYLSKLTIRGAAAPINNNFHILRLILLAQSLKRCKIDRA